MEQPSFSSALFDVMTECAPRRQQIKCRHSFGSPECGGCVANAYQYVDADPRHMKLAMLQAESRAYGIRTRLKPLKTSLLVLALILGFLLFKKHQVDVWRTQQWAEREAVEASIESTGTTGSDIERTLQLVARDLKNRTDVNRDGLVNCIDAAVLFYGYYPDKRNVCIELNYNPAARFNHLFNCVRINGVWKAIEPQAAYGGYKTYWMYARWPGQYESSRNKDVTRDYLRFLR